MNQNKTKLDVVIIATLRPDILDITLNTFYHGFLKNFNCRLIVNIDPIGDSSYTQKDVIINGWILEASIFSLSVIIPISIILSIKSN